MAIFPGQLCYEKLLILHIISCYISVLKQKILSKKKEKVNQ